MPADGGDVEDLSTAVSDEEDSRAAGGDVEDPRAAGGDVEGSSWWCGNLLCLTAGVS